MRHVLSSIFVAAASLTGYFACMICEPASASELNRQSDWPMQLGTYAATRHTSLDQINPSNVRHLRLAWTFSTGVLRGHEGSPLVVGDVMYIATPFPNVVYALDLNNDGKILWKYTPRQDPSVVSVMCCDTVNRSLTFADGRVFLHQADTTLVALDAKSGREIWRVENGDPKRGESNTGAMLAADGKLIVGISGGEFGVQCHVTAYDQKTGQRLWRAYSEGSDKQILLDPERTTVLGQPAGKNSSLSSWQGEQWKTGGGCTWGWFSYDPALNLVYYGSGNPSSWNPAQRPGDNRWTDTIFARDLATGTAKWVYQMTPHDEWDYDGVNEMVLIDRENLKLLVHLDKNGFLYQLDRTSGRLLSADKADPSVNWADRIEMNDQSPTFGRPVRDERYSTERGTEEWICPSNFGIKNEAPVSFDEDSRLLVAPLNHLCMKMSVTAANYAAGQPFTGGHFTLMPAPEEEMGKLVAWNIDRRELVWTNRERFSVWSGPLTTRGGLTFFGTLDGYFRALDTRTGRLLFQFKAPSGIVGNPIAFQHRGKEYVAVLSGVGGWAGIGLSAGATTPDTSTDYRRLESYTSGGGTLLVFTLPE